MLHNQFLCLFFEVISFFLTTKGIKNFSFQGVTCSNSNMHSSNDISCLLQQMQKRQQKLRQSLNMVNINIVKNAENSPFVQISRQNNAESASNQSLSQQSASGVSGPSTSRSFSLSSKNSDHSIGIKLPISDLVDQNSTQQRQRPQQLYYVHFFKMIRTRSSNRS